MNLAAIFKVLEHLDDLEIIGLGNYFAFQNKAKIFRRQNICRPGVFMGLSLHSETIAPIIREK